MFRTSRLPVGLTPERANELLSRLISESGDTSGAFLGRWEETRFEVRRVNSYKSSYLPLTRGRVVNSPGGAELELSFRPHRQVFVFFSIWLTFLLLASGLIAVSSFTHGAQRLLFLGAPFGLAALTLFLGYRVFRSDCGWMEETLKEHLENEVRKRGS
jgi:H+/gluconate symporter-like permease